MNIKTILTLLFTLLSAFFWAQQSDLDILETSNGVLKITPITHGSLVLSFNNKTIYVDPVGNSTDYKLLNTPDIILITDIHADHLNVSTLDSLDTSKALFIVPKAVAAKLPSKYSSKIIVLNNGQGVHRMDFFIRAVPMYNVPEEPSSKHPKGRGNGYVIAFDEKQVYISGDTGNIPEMTNLQGIDVAFICMNLPYTMDIEQAAKAVEIFQPKIVYPYHYRGKDGLSDIEAFKDLVTKKSKHIEVRLRNWYPAN